MLQDRGQSEWAAVVNIRLCILILTLLILWGLFTKGGTEKSFYNGSLHSKM